MNVITAGKTFVPRIFEVELAKLNFNNTMFQFLIRQNFLSFSFAMSKQWFRIFLSFCLYIVNLLLCVIVCCWDSSCYWSIRLGGLEEQESPKVMDIDEILRTW